jgi:hypothetical protein
MVRRSQIVETKFIKWLFLSVSALAILFAPDSAVSIWFKRASDTGVDVNSDKKNQNRNTKHTPLSFVGRRREEQIRTPSNFVEIKLRFSGSGLIYLDRHELSNQTNFIGILRTWFSRAAIKGWEWEQNTRRFRGLAGEWDGSSDHTA